MMKHTLLRENNQDMSLQPVLRDSGISAEPHGPVRIQGGNWKMQGFRSSGHVHDGAECEMSIAEFMVGTQERNGIDD
jgi:hypothetical protein